MVWKTKCRPAYRVVILVQCSYVRCVQDTVHSCEPRCGVQTPRRCSDWERQTIEQTRQTRESIWMAILWTTDSPLNFEVCTIQFALCGLNLLISPWFLVWILWLSTTIDQDWATTSLLVYSFSMIRANDTDSTILKTQLYQKWLRMRINSVDT